MPSPQWSIQSDVTTQPSVYIVSDPSAFSFGAGAGVVMMPVGGPGVYRFTVDVDGALCANPDVPTDADIYLESPGAGVVIQGLSGALFRVRVDPDGALVSEPYIQVPGWTINADGRVMYGDVMPILAAGITFTTPDGLHVYKPGVDLDNETLISIPIS